MFIGHYAVALGAKDLTPKVSLGTLFLAAQLADLLWPLFLILGLEHVRIDPSNTAFTPLDFYDYPISHSLVGAIAWSVVMGGLYYAIRKDLKTSGVLGLVVFSHWILDFITHRPDLPFGLGVNLTFGLRLWNSVSGTMIVEGALFIAGIALYLRATSAKDNIGRYGFWSLIILLVLIYLASIVGPPPPSESSIAIVGNLGWLFVIWAFWIDRHRSVSAQVHSPPL